MEEFGIAGLVEALVDLFQQLVLTASDRYESAVWSRADEIRRKSRELVFHLIIGLTASGSLTESTWQRTRGPGTGSP